MSREIVTLGGVPMPSARPFTDLIERLRAVGLRPTRQRLALAKILFDGADIEIAALPPAPPGRRIAQVDLGIHVAPAAKK